LVCFSSNEFALISALVTPKWPSVDAMINGVSPSAFEMLMSASAEMRYLQERHKSQRSL
jgi:hypothetical protein